MSFAKLIGELCEGTHTKDELSEATGLHYTTVRTYVAALHREKLVHIAGYAADKMGRENSKPLWAFGPGVNKKRKAATDAQRAQRARDKRKALTLHRMFTGAPAPQLTTN